MSVQFHGQNHFAEVAEALGIETAMIFGAYATRTDGWMVLYTPNYPDHTIYRAHLERDADGILRLQSPLEKVPGLAEKIDEIVAKVVEEGKRDVERGERDE